MNLIDDPNILAPPFIKPEFLLKSSQFAFQLPLHSQHPHPIHFYVASTFGCCLQQTTSIRVIDANSSITLQFKVKMTNLLGGGNEFVVIYASNHKGAEQFPHNNGTMKAIQIRVDEESKVDPAILEILESQVEFCIGQGQNFKNEGELVKALNKYEEAYEILRKSQKVIDLLVDCRLTLKDFAGAVRDIESILISKPNDLHFLLLKTKVIMIWEEAEINKNEELFHYIKASLEHVKDSLEELSPADRNVFQFLKGQFKKYDKITKGEPNKLLEGLYQKALASYSQDKPIAQFYPSRELLEQQLKELLLQTKHQDMATPEEVIDPINYEIMQKPYILPSGHSYEEKSLKAYFMSKGYKDPVTRTDINYQCVVPNLTLERYIHSHPKLKQWQMYEYDLVHY